MGRLPECKCEKHLAVNHAHMHVGGKSNYCCQFEDSHGGNEKQCTHKSCETEDSKRASVGISDVCWEGKEFKAFAEARGYTPCAFCEEQN